MPPVPGKVCVSMPGTQSGFFTSPAANHKLSHASTRCQEQTT
jgi:hypothetical protein